MLAALILAAGESSRMGTPKALLKIDQETFIDCIVRKARLAGLSECTVVTGPDHEAISRNLPKGCSITRNEDYVRGQISSLQKGIRSLGQHTTSVLVWPVDQPTIRDETIAKLVATFYQEKQDLTIPLYKNRKGHPVIYSDRAMEAALKLSAAQTGKDLQYLFRASTTLMEIDDRGVVTDIDTPDDYDRYIKPFVRQQGGS